MNIFRMFVILFFIYSIAGWLFEVIEGWILTKKLVNRGFLIGPYCSIYGYGGLLITIFLTNLKMHPIAFFIASIGICAVLEYSTSYILEKIFKVRWWDYSNIKFNLNGRICLPALIFFGLMGNFIIYVLNPFIMDVILRIPNILQNILVSLLLIVYLIDNIFSWKAVSKIKIISNEIRDNTEEITQKVKELITEKYKSAQRIIRAFPTMQIVKSKIEERIKNLKGK